MRIIAHWLILSVAVWLTTRIKILNGGVSVDPVYVALIVGACLTLFNMFLKPIIHILTLPINILTLGLFSVVINGFIFWYLGTVIKGFTVTSFWAALVGSVLVSLINWLVYKVLRFDL
ncbi:phage holin family protein [Candidatus Nomurabacteria bacterium]|nr:phage holin family protein [Candidatus Nomurabacteria bacterium]